MKYKGSEYTLKKITLAVKSVMADILLKRENIIFELTKDIDLSEQKKYLFEKNQLDIKLSHLDKGTDKYKTVEAQLKNLNDSYENNYILQNTLRHYDNVMNVCLLKLVADEKLITDIIPKILNEEIEIDPNDPEAVDFATEVLSDFFLSMKTN